MRNQDLPSPGAAETYFNQSIFGQLYTVLADTLGRHDRAPAGGTRRTALQGSVEQSRPKRSLLDRLDAWFWRQAQNDREAYLAGSSDVFELERRVEAYGRGTFQ